MLYFHKLFSPGPKGAGGAPIKSEELNEDDATVNTEEVDKTEGTAKESEEKDDYDETEELDDPEALENPEEKENPVF